MSTNEPSDDSQMFRAILQSATTLQPAIQAEVDALVATYTAEMAEMSLSELVDIMSQPNGGSVPVLVYRACVMNELIYRRDVLARVHPDAPPAPWSDETP